MLFIDWWNAQPNIIGKLEFKDGSLESSAHKQKSAFDFLVYVFIALGTYFILDARVLKAEGLHSGNKIARESNWYFQLLLAYKS